MATQKPPKTSEEWMVHYLKEQTVLLESIKAWVTFFGIFGILLVISLVLSAFIFAIN